MLESAGNLLLRALLVLNVSIVFLSLCFTLRYPSVYVLGSARFV
jgi:hypothetical protein